jgi:hypothetical protein
MACRQSNAIEKNFGTSIQLEAAASMSFVESPPTSELRPSFETLIREHSFKYPSSPSSLFPALQEAVQPHIDSFNAITADNLLEIAVRDIGKKTAFDHKTDANGGLGNKLTFWLEDVQLSRPTLTNRERTSLNRKLYPAEVHKFNTEVTIESGEEDDL